MTVILTWGFDGGAFTTIEAPTVREVLNVYSKMNAVAEERVRQIVRDELPSGDLPVFDGPSPWLKADLIAEGLTPIFAADISKPVDDLWLAHNGGSCPYFTGTLIDVKYRDGHIEYGIPAMQAVSMPHNLRGAFSWDHSDHAHDIVAHRAHDPKRKES